MTSLPEPPASVAAAPTLLNADQQAAVDAVDGVTGFAAFLLFGGTGSGKTEVYLSTVERLLRADPQAQALLLVPEIGLTPQLVARFAARFPGRTMVSLHSGLTPAQRLRHWLLAGGVQRGLSKRDPRLAVADSKKLHGKGGGEHGVLLLERARAKLREGDVDIALRGYSHVFVWGPDDPCECSTFAPVAEMEGAYQEVLGRPELRELVRCYFENRDPLPLRKRIAQEDVWSEIEYQRPTDRTKIKAPRVNKRESDEEPPIDGGRSGGWSGGGIPSHLWYGSKSDMADS